ncbi:MAG: SusC/RagA family TonB-linked outer membrane protein [Cytophagaceae bacterium]|nr:SusC/RagA family TonB-linked outer membrane protein [Cytophagaceae bacterium]
MKKHVLLSLLALTVAWAQAVAQDRKITGKVTAADDNSPLPGVSVLLKGTLTGTNTNQDGEFAINVPVGGGTLVVSFVGFAPQETPIDTRTVVNVKLATDSRLLTEVVVTAQGIVREKRALGFAVTTIDKKMVESRPESDVARVLQGKVPGVNITSTGGISGSGTNINIRGYSSISGNIQPLWVVDGIPFNSNTNQRGGFTSGGQVAASRFLDIDANNIESISVLKGLAATVLYGDQGRNGVILVSTKNGNGKQRPASVTLTQSLFNNKIASLPKFQNNWGGGFQNNPGFFFSNWGDKFNRTTTVGAGLHPYASLQNASIRNQFPEYASVTGYPYKLFQGPENFFRTGLISNSNLNLTGGTERFGYNATVGYAKEQGFVENNDLKRLNIGVGFNVKVSKKVTLITSFNFSNTDQKSPPINAGTGNNTLNGFPSIFANVFFTPRSVDLIGLPFETPLDNRSVYFRSGNDIPNPRWITKYYSTTGITDRFFGSSTINVDLLDNLVLTYRGGLDTYTEQQEYKFPKGGVNFLTGGYFTNTIKNTIVNNDLILSYNKPISERLTVAGRIGANLRNDRYRVDAVTSINQLTFGLMRHNNFTENAASNYTQEETRMGIYGDLTVDFGNYLYLNLAGRNDWTSTVEKENRRIFYPSASVSFVPTAAFPGLASTTLNFLKFRAGLGTSAGFPSPYNTRSILNQVARGFLDVAGNITTTQSVDNTLGNPNLKPELQTELEVGTEARFFNNRIGLDLTLYRRETRDLITSTPIDPATGYTSTTINIGKLRNSGIELGLNGTVIRSGSFGWDVTLNYDRNVPLVVELSDALKEVVVAGFTDLGNFAIADRPFNVIKGKAALRDDQGRRIVGGNGQYLADPTIRELGDPNPKFRTTLINSVTWKGLTLSAQVDYRHGGAIYSATAGTLLGRGVVEDTDFDRDNTYILPGVKQDGQPNDIQITASDVGFNVLYFGGVDEFRVWDGSTLRLREASLAYNLPAKILKRTFIKGATITLSGSNLWFRALYFPKSINFDTDVLSLGVGNGYGFDYLTGPSSRRLGGTLKLTF